MALHKPSNHCWECLHFVAEYCTKNWDWNVSHLMYVKLNFRGFEFSYFRLNSSYWIANSIWIAVLDLKSTFSESKLRRLPCLHYVSFRSKLIGKKAKPTRHAKKIHLHAKCTKKDYFSTRKANALLGRIILRKYITTTFLRNWSTCTLQSYERIYLGT